MLTQFLLALLSGVLLVVVHPEAAWTFLAPFAIAPLVVALAREWRARYRFLLGYAAGVVFWAGINYWIQPVMAVHGGMGNAAGAAVFVLFCLLKALHFGVFGLLGGIVVQHRFALPALACLWVAMERIPGFYFYTWLTLGNAGAGMGVPLRLAPFTGVYGVSFVFAAMGAGVALLVLRRPRAQLLPLLLLPLLYLLPELPAPARGTEPVLVVQPNASDEQGWTAESLSAFVRGMEYTTMEAGLRPGQPPPRMVFWPEMPAPLYWSDPELRSRLSTLARTVRAPLATGVVAHTPKGDALNSVVEVRASGEFGRRYDKIQLVPFGEYVPWPWKSIVPKVTEEVGDFAAGREVVLLEGAGRPLGVFICYESAFPQLVREVTAKGAEVLANLSNDGYFFRTAARRQHLSLVRMRAAETGRWIVRATNNGITASVDPAGRVMEQLPEFERRAARLHVTPRRELTPYVRYGDWFAWSCTALAAALLLLTQVPGYRP